MKSETRRLYRPGETVYLVSRKYPHYNGEYRIMSIHVNGDTYLDRITHALTNIKLTHVPVCYRFVQVLRNESGQEMLVTEAQLRKKYTPSGLSFQQLMALVN